MKQKFFFQKAKWKKMKLPKSKKDSINQDSKIHKSKFIYSKQQPKISGRTISFILLKRM